MNRTIKRSTWYLLLVKQQLTINNVQTVHSNFWTTLATTKYATLNNDMRVQQPFFHDHYEKGSYKYYASVHDMISTEDSSTEFDTEFEYYDTYKQKMNNTKKIIPRNFFLFLNFKFQIMS